ncbi:MAG: Gfo/Idh/MocA family protein [Kiritimatiellia bacterium]
MQRKAKVGMIGLRGYGNIVRQGLKRCRTLELAAIWSRDRESVERSLKELPSKVCESYEALLQEPIDGVIIVNPNYLHLEYGLKAAAAGKSILVEKPMTNTVTEALELIRAFRKSGKLLAVKHLLRYSPENLQIRQWIRDGTLGKVLSVEAYTSHSSSKNFPPDRWKRDPKKCPAAPLTQLGVHYIDTAMSFLGHPDWVQSHHRNVLKLSDNVDCTVTTIGFGEVLFTVHAHYVVPGYQRLAVYGTEGIAVVDEAGLRLRREGESSFSGQLTEGEDALVRILNEYGESLLTGKPFETSGEESIYVVAAAEAAIRSAAEGGRRVEIPEVLPPGF